MTCHIPAGVLIHRVEQLIEQLDIGGSRWTTVRGIEERTMKTAFSDHFSLRMFVMALAPACAIDDVSLFDNVKLTTRAERNLEILELR